MTLIRDTAIVVKTRDCAGALRVTHPNDALLQEATCEALRRMEDRLGVVFETEPIIRLSDGQGLLARIGWDEDHATIDVSPRCIDEIQTLWREALASSVLIDETGERLKAVDGAPVNDARLIHLSLTWLVLHEFMHLRLGHLDILDAAALAECDLEEDDDDGLAVADHWSSRLDENELARVRPCLELQADNDANEVMFGVYDESQWLRFRVEAAAIFVVMAVMERSETRAKREQRTYPRVATRFFTLFAQLFQYWLYDDADLVAGDGETFVHPTRAPSGEDFERYAKVVLALAVNDAIQIASAAGAKSFLDDLGAGAAFFSDLYEIQYADELAEAPLQTPAAQEWRELLPVNEKIMALSGLREESLDRIRSRPAI